MPEKEAETNGNSGSIKGLEDLTEEVSRHLRTRGIMEATGPQKLAVGPILEGRDVLLIAPTGYGKTEATFGPLLQRLVKEGPFDGIGLLYIAPLRALNRDILERMKKWCEDLDLKIAVRHSDTTQSERSRQARKPPDVLVTTPETLQIMFTGSRLRKGLSDVRHVIIDEVHELFGDERGSQLDFALSRLDRLADRKVQRVGLSATVPDPARMAEFLGGPERDVKVVKGSWRKEYSFEVDSPEVLEGDKEIAKVLGCTSKVAAVVRRIRELITAVGSTLIFVNSRDMAEALTTRLKKLDEEISVGIHHGSLSRETRTSMETEFKEGSLKGLVCTSSMELGMDIGSVDLVIQFKSPKEVSRLLQRGGRAGHRIGDVSRCVILATEADDIMESAVVADLAKRRRLEARSVRRMVISVLANQILSMASAEKAVTLGDITDVAGRTFTFSGIDMEQVEKVARFLHGSKLIYLEDGWVKGGRRAREYFYSNISMIPDERIMLIRDLSTRSVIGSLDMDFVLSNLEPFSKFVVRGQPWRVVDIGDEEVTVEPVTDLGPVPAWSGSDIPVPWEVARRVGEIRGQLVSELKEGGDGSGALSQLSMTDAAKASMLRQFREQVDEGFHTPDDTSATIEIGMEGVVIGICGGTRTNETMGRVIAALLSAKHGGNVIVDYDPYRILLVGDLRLKEADIRWAIRQAPVSDLGNMVPVLLKNSPLLRWQMLHVAKKFGVMKTDTDPLKFPMRRLLARWRETMIMEESLNKVMHERLDIEHASEMFGALVSGDMELNSQRISPLSMSSSSARSEFMSSEGASSEVIDSVRERLMTKAAVLTCMGCGAKLRATPERAKRIVGCHKCGSRMLAPIPPGDLKTKKAVEKGMKNKRLSADDRKRFRAAMMAAELFMSYGYRAVLALAGRGIGPKTAGRILEVPYESDEELVKRIFADEVKYARTRRFWD